MKFIKKSLLSAVILSTCSVSFAETRGFMSFDLGFGDSDFDNDIVIDCLSMALDAYIMSHDGYGPGTKAQGPRNIYQVRSLGLGPCSRADIHYG